MKAKDWGSRKDANHGEIIRTFDRLYWKIKDTSALPGFCDLIVKKGQNIVFIEIKDPNKPPSAQKLTAAEQAFHNYWGDVRTIKSVDDVLELDREMARNFK